MKTIKILLITILAALLTGFIIQGYENSDKPQQVKNTELKRTPSGKIWINIKAFKQGELIYVYFTDRILPAIVVENDTVSEFMTYKRPNWYGSQEDYYIVETVRYSELPYNKD